MRDRDTLFHEKWLGLAQPIEGLVFSVPVLADAQIAPELRTELTTSFRSHLTATEPKAIRSLPAFFREFLGYADDGMLVARAELPEALSFYASEGGQEIRPSYALGRGPFEVVDVFATPGSAPAAEKAPPTYFALVWDLTESGEGIDLDAHENVTGPWRYPPTAKLERLLRHTGIPIGFLFNGTELRLVYAPAGESTAHLTFRVEHLERSDGRPLLSAMELLLHARRAYSASAAHTLEGLLAESRRRQADVTSALAKQVFEAVEILVAGFESAAARDVGGGGSDRPDWLRAALEADGDHLYQGVLSIVLRLVFLLYAEDQSLLPVEHPTYAAHLSLSGLHARLSHDAGAHPESMHHRFGAYGQLLSLFRSVYFGVKHGSGERALSLPPRRGRLFDPNAFPFLEGGLPEWTAAVLDPAARAAAHPPSVDDRCIYDVLHRLVVFEGQRLSYRTLDVEQIGSVYESLMGYHVLRLVSPAVRLGKHGVWVEADAIRALSKTDRAKFLKETCGLNPGPITSIETALSAVKTTADAAEALGGFAPGKKGDAHQHRATAGTLVLQPGEERRRTASHYTPRSLTEKVVRRTLEPLLKCLGDAPRPEQILELKICDPAMGSGAFLVATCRELANEIVAAWTRQGELAKIIEAHDDAHLHARRLVAQKCLYGVDKNFAAVELAKLSLWLVTLSKALPFTFVDHALRQGDSLVGLNFDQIAAFHWSPPKQAETFRPLVQEALEQAVDLRQQILALADREDVEAQSEKRRLLEFSQQAIDRVRMVADLCVGAFFAETKDAAREKERKRRADVVHRWLAGDEDAAGEVETLAGEARRRLTPFHWWVEFPEVFFQERPDPLQGGVKNGAACMEGLIGNPPFLGGGQVSGLLGDNYRDWLLDAHPGTHGNGDLAAHFFRRAAALLGSNGVMGLIATNTIAQGDTHGGGLAPLVQMGWRIVDATVSMDWPGEAAVVVSLVHLAHGRACEFGGARLNGYDVQCINSRLQGRAERDEASRLAANASFFSLGTKTSVGFVLTPEERDRLVVSSAHNSARIFPYLGGDEINNSPTQTYSRFLIHFGSMGLAEAELWPDLMAIVRARVKPDRDRQRENTIGNWMREHWWRAWADRPALYAALGSLRRCLVISRHTKHVVFAAQPVDRVFSEAIFVFPLDAHTPFAVLQSRIHEPWARLLSSSMKTDLRYSGSDCFETFPFPQPDPRTVVPALETAGQGLYEARAAFMVATNQGLTKTYNALKDPANDDPRILALRGLHEAMDRAVLEAYGWHKLAEAVPPFCPLNDADKAALAAFEDDVIDRLYVLNAERAREEERLGLGKKKAGAKGGATAKRKKGGGEADGEGQGDLF